MLKIVQNQYFFLISLYKHSQIKKYNSHSFYLLSDFYFISVKILVISNFEIGGIAL